MNLLLLLFILCVKELFFKRTSESLLTDMDLFKKQWCKNFRANKKTLLQKDFLYPRRSWHQSNVKTGSI